MHWDVSWQFCGIESAWASYLISLVCVSILHEMQMRVLPSVQPFHAIAYPIDAMLALEIRYYCFRIWECNNMLLVIADFTMVLTWHERVMHLEFFVREFSASTALDWLLVVLVTVRNMQNTVPWLLQGLEHSHLTILQLFVWRVKGVVAVYELGMSKLPVFTTRNHCPGFIKQSTVTCWSSNSLNIFLDEMIV